MESSAFSPSHISGIVGIHINPDPNKSGSTGIGFSINHGVRTIVNAIPSNKNRITVTINDKIVVNAEISEFVVKNMVKLQDKKYDLNVLHKIDIPIGVGLGTSGAAALSLSIALNKALQLKLSKFEAANIAHTAEIACRTGLGTVCSEMKGGFEVRIKPGSPQYCEIINFPIRQKNKVVILVLDRISTSYMLEQLQNRNEIMKLSRILIDRFLKNPTIDEFLLLANNFSNKLGVSSRIRRIMQDANNSGFVCGTALFGETVFSLVNSNEVSDLKKIFSRHRIKGSKILESQIETRGAHLL